MDKMNEMEIMLSSATTTTMRDEVWCPIVRESGPDPRIGMKGQRLLGSDSTVLQACELGLSLQGWNSIQNRLLLMMFGTA